MISKKTSLPLVAAIISSLLMVIEIVLYFTGLDMAESSGDSIGYLGASLNFFASVPHIVTYAVGVILNWISCGTKNKGCMLAAAILYGIAIALYLLNLPFVLPGLILAIVAYCKMSKMAEIEAQIRIHQTIVAVNADDGNNSAVPFFPAHEKEPFVLQPRTAYIIGAIFFALLIAAITVFVILAI